MAEPTTPNKPTHDVCFVKDRGEGQKGIWTDIGAAWAHKDKQGLSMQLDFIPADLSAGRIVVRLRTEKPQAEGQR